MKKLKALLVLTMFSAFLFSPLKTTSNPKDCCCCGYAYNGGYFFTGNWVKVGLVCGQAGSFCIGSIVNPYNGSSRYFDCSYLWFQTVFACGS
jgi:hypothetical protein